MSSMDDLNNIFESIKFTVEWERGGKLSFLDVGFISRQADGTLGRSVY